MLPAKSSPAAGAPSDQVPHAASKARSHAGESAAATGASLYPFICLVLGTLAVASGVTGRVLQLLWVVQVTSVNVVLAM